MPYEPWQFWGGDQIKQPSGKVWKLHNQPFSAVDLLYNSSNSPTTSREGTVHRQEGKAEVNVLQLSYTPPPFPEQMFPVAFPYHLIWVL